jgi:simple sugar transport system permease protein
MSHPRSNWLMLATSVAALVTGLLLGLCIAWIAGENPVRVGGILFKGAFGSSYDFGMTLFYATPLILTGLAVAVAAHAGLFNVGAEGQLTLGCLAAAAAGTIPLPPLVAPLVAGAAAFGAGAVWGFVPGYLKSRRGAHEVITTILLNFIASAMASYTVLHWLQNPDSQNPESAPILPQFRIPLFPWADGAPAGWAIVLAVMTALCCWFALRRTNAGYEVRAVGGNPEASRLAGISPASIHLKVMTVSGGIAGLVALAEVLGNAGKYRVGFSADYGFTGIAVALLARNNPLAVIPAAFAFAALHKGATELDIETEHITRELAAVLQGVIILAASAPGLWHWFARRHVSDPVVAKEGNTAC